MGPALSECTSLSGENIYTDTKEQTSKDEAGFELNSALFQSVQIQREQKRRIKWKIRKELEKSSAMTEEEELAIWDIWSLSMPDRWRLYR